MEHVHNLARPLSASLSVPLPLSPGRGKGPQQRGHFPSRYPGPGSSSPRPGRLPKVASFGLQVEGEDLPGAGATARWA